MAEAALGLVAEHPDGLVRDQYAMDIAARCRLEVDLVRRWLAEGRFEARAAEPGNVGAATIGAAVTTAEVAAMTAEVGVMGARVRADPGPPHRRTTASRGTTRRRRGRPKEADTTVGTAVIPGSPPGPGTTAADTGVVPTAAAGPVCSAARHPSSS